MIIKIKNLRIKTNIGVYDWEKNFDREIIVNLALKTNHTKSLRSDDLSDTIDYDVIVNKIKKVASMKSFKLIEKMAQSMMNEIMSDKRIAHCHLEIDKVGVVEAVDSFCVSIEQSRQKKSPKN